MVNMESGNPDAKSAGGGLDRAGMVVSCLCALHCAVLPAVVAILPTIGLGLLASEATEMALMGSSAATGAISLGLGFRRHRSGLALIVLGLGLAMLALGRLAESTGTEILGVAAVVSGGLAIAGAHLLNLRLCRACPGCGVGPERPMAPGSRGESTGEARP